MMIKVSVPECIFGNELYYLKRYTSSSSFFGAFQIIVDNLNLK